MGYLMNTRVGNRREAVRKLLYFSSLEMERFPLLCFSQPASQPAKVGDACMRSICSVLKVHINEYRTSVSVSVYMCVDFDW